MSGYERLLSMCSDNEKEDLSNAIMSSTETNSCIITYLDMENSKKIAVMRPPLYEKWSVSIADLAKKETKIICEDGVIEYLK